MDNDRAFASHRATTVESVDWVDPRLKRIYAELESIKVGFPKISSVPYFISNALAAIELADWKVADEIKDDLYEL